MGSGLVPVPQMVRLWGSGDLGDWTSQTDVGWQHTVCQPTRDVIGLLNECHSHCLRTLGTLADVELNPLVLLE